MYIFLKICYNVYNQYCTLKIEWIIPTKHTTEILAKTRESAKKDHRPERSPFIHLTTLNGANPAGIKDECESNVKCNLLSRGRREMEHNEKFTARRKDYLDGKRADAPGH